MAQYGVKEVLDFTIAKYTPNLIEREPMIHVDYATMTDVENAGERIDVGGGRGHARLLSFDHSKTVAVNFSLPLIDMKMLALISGDEVVDKVSDVFRKETICVEMDSDTDQAFIELKRKPIENSVYLYRLDGLRDLGTQAKPLDVAPSGDIGVGEMFVDEGNKKIIVDAETFPVGEEVIVFYTSTTEMKVENLRVDPTMFPKAVSVFGETIFRNQNTEEDEFYNVRIHKGRMRPEYTLSMNSTDVAVLEMTMDVYAYREKCRNRDTYIEYIKDDSNYEIE